MTQEPEFNYGEASLQLGLALYESQDYLRACDHLEKHIRNWSHPPAFIALADLYKIKDNLQSACTTLETMINIIESSPPYIYHKNSVFLREGKKRLKLWNKLNSI